MVVSRPSIAHPIEGVLVAWSRISVTGGDAAAVVTSAERQRLQEYVWPADRARFALGVAITRTILGELLALAPWQVPLTRRCRWCNGQHGPPRLPGREFTVSVSHSGDLVLVAFSSVGQVGIDIEVLGTDRFQFQGIDDQLLAPPEVEWLSGRNKDGRTDALATYWTRKEAILKASEDGLRRPLPELTVSPPDAPAEVVAWSSRPDLVERLDVTDLFAWPGHAAAVATIDAETSQVRLVHCDPPRRFARDDLGWRRPKPPEE